MLVDDKQALVTGLGFLIFPDGHQSWVIDVTQVSFTGAVKYLYSNYSKDGLPNYIGVFPGMDGDIYTWGTDCSNCFKGLVGNRRLVDVEGRETGEP